MDMKEVFDFHPLKDIGRNDRQKQAQWAESAVNFTTVYSCVRIFDNSCLYSKAAMIELFPKLKEDYSKAPY